MGWKRRAVLLAAASVPLVFAGLAGCGGGGSNGSSGLVADAPVTTRSVYGPLEFTLTAPKTVYKRGEQVVMTFTVQNTNADTVVLDFFDKDFDGYPIRAEVRHDGNTTRSSQAGVLGGFQPVEMPPGAVFTYPIAWLQNDDKGNQVSAGKYTVRVRYSVFHVRLGSLANPQAIQPTEYLSSQEIDKIVGPEPVEVTIR